MSAAKIDKIVQKSIRDGNMTPLEGITLVGALQFLQDQMRLDPELRRKFADEYGDKAGERVFNLLWEGPAVSWDRESAQSPTWPEAVPTPLPQS